MEVASKPSDTNAESSADSVIKIYLGIAVDLLHEFLNVIWNVR